MSIARCSVVLSGMAFRYYPPCGCLRSSVRLTQFGRIFNRQPSQFRERKQTVGVAFRIDLQISDAARSKHEAGRWKIPKDFDSGHRLLDSRN